MVRRQQLPVNGTTSDSHAVTIREAELGYLTQLAGWSRFEEAARSMLHALPSDYRTVFRNEKNSIWRIAPDRALVMSEDMPQLESSDDIAVLDLSHARIRLVLEGPGAAGLLSRVMALDFSEAAFPIGTFAQSAIHRIGVLVDRRAPDRFDLFIPTTWAIWLTRFLADHLRKAA